MGLIRRRALEDVGGWDEWCITEDADLSFRLLRAGWSGLHVDRSFGKGIMPLTFEALKGQRFRWCFGGIQILRSHWRSMLAGRKTRENQLTTAQRWAYLTGAVQWYGDLLGLVFFLFLLVGAGNIVFSGGLLYRKLTGFLLAAIPLLVVLGLLRAVALLRRGTGASWREAFGAFFIWQATGLTVARASVQALFAKEAAFLRTPKTQGEHAWTDALKGNWAECLLGLVGVAAIVGALSHSSGYGGPLLAALLLWPTASFLAAPYNSLSAQRASLPPALRERRRTEYLRTGRRRLTYAVASLGLAGAAAAATMALLAPGPTNVVPPQMIAPAQGQPVRYGPAPAPTRARSSGQGDTSGGAAAHPSTPTTTPTTTSTGTTTAPATTTTTPSTTPTTPSTPSTTPTTPATPTTSSTTGATSTPPATPSGASTTPPTG
jgi:hypothetical protein